MGETPLMLAMARTEKGHAAPNLAQPVGGNHTAWRPSLDGLVDSCDAPVFGRNMAASVFY